MTARLQETLESYYGAERRRDALGLDGTRALLQALGNPERRFRSVHVAGTNGKGSVCTLIERVLRAAGFSTGLFTSPHLVDYRERIRVDGVWADGARLEERLELLRRTFPGEERTFFEITTALAFDDFAARGAEWAVVEVGLGGRLDCTNVIEPAVTAITSVGYDHTEILGDTLAQVAFEKAGIVKPGVPVVIGALPAEALEVVTRVARERQAPVVPAPRRARLDRVALDAQGARFTATVDPFGALELVTPLRGAHQVENATVALDVLAALAESGVPIPAHAVREGFALARWPGRLEPCPGEPRLWWDAAHNREGMGRLARAWTKDLRFPAPKSVVIAISRDKDADGMLRDLRSFATGDSLMTTRATNPRAFDPQELARLASGFGWNARAVPGVAAACDAALAAPGEGPALLVGSIFAVGEAMQRFGGAPGEIL